MNFLLSAGEASGDTYGAQLADALGRLAPSANFFGMGGEKMRTSGADLLVHANEVAVVGLVEVVTHLPGIRRRFKHLVAEAARRKPDAAVLIDFPDFNLRLARELHRLGIPVFYFVSPQIWAWRTGRVQQIKKYVRKMIVIFPFEQEFYRRHGIEVSYVGHALAYVPPPQISREEFASKYHLQVTLTDNAPATLMHSRAAVVASGTATVEAALSGTPFVVVYRLAPLTWVLGRCLVKLDTFAMPNLIAGRKIVPELIQKDFTAQNVFRELKAIIADGPARQQMESDLRMVQQRLHDSQDASSPAQRAAHEILAALQP